MKEYLNKQEVCGIPDPMAPFHEKKTKDYGLRYAKSIEQEWFNGGLIQKGCLFLKRHDWIREMRAFNRGENSIEDDKLRIARQRGDMDLLNLNWERVNFPEKFTNIARNSLSDEYYTVDVRSADRYSLLEKKKKVLKHKRNMYAKPMLEKAKALGLPDLTFNGFIPEDEEELSLWSQIKERPAQEIREEIWINYVKQSSDWDYIKTECARDLVECDIMTARCFTDPINGIQLKYVDPENYGHSYVNRKDFKDAFYHFVVDTITIGDIKRESRGEISDAELRQIAKHYSGNDTFSNISSNFYGVDMDVILKQKVHVMRFTFKTVKEEVYKKYHDRRNNVRKIAKRDTTYEVPEGAEKSRLSKELDTWMEGNYIVGTNYMYDYKQSERIARDEQNKALPPFITRSSNIYKNQLRSFLSNIKPLCDQLQYFHLMIQKLSLELKPDLTVINLDSLAELGSDVKNAKKSETWKQALSILNVKGVIFEQTIDLGDEGGTQKTQSARPQSSPQGSALGVLLNLWAHYYNIIRDITGINPAVDGSIAPDSLVGVNKMLRMAGNTATKHLVDATIGFDKDICYTISSRIKGIFSLSRAQHLQKIYEKALGRHSLDIAEGIKDRHLHDFGFYIEMNPSGQEIQELKERIAISLQNGNLDDAEAAEALRIAKTNMKQAHEYLSFVRKRRIKEKMRQDAFNQKLQSQNNIAAAQAKTEGEIQVYQAKKQIDLQYEANLSGIKLKEKATELQIEAPEKKRQFEQQVYLESLKNMQVINLTKYKEEEKRSREKESDTRQSKLIEQRQENLPSFDFSNQFDLDKLLSI